MGIVAVDVVLLPAGWVMDKAIEINHHLVVAHGGGIILNRESCLPHISLSMGVIDEANVHSIEDVLQGIISELHGWEQEITRVVSEKNARGIYVSSFEIARTDQILHLHELVMQRMQPFFRYEVDAAMINADEVSESTLEWIRNYATASAYENFWPHITLGYGQTDWYVEPMRFQPVQLALCHLGNHCTCTKVLAAVSLGDG